jgi:putative mRNA 3-end processing factor
MKLKFLGGADEVGNFALFLEHKSTQLLVDYGFSPTKPPKYPEEPPPVKFLLLTHAHIDHSGMIPVVCRNYDTNVIATPATVDTAHLLIEDSLKIAITEGYPEFYTKTDLNIMMRNISLTKFGDKIKIGDLEVFVHPAGHIPGACMYQIDKNILITGDINTIDTRLVPPAKYVKCDTLIVEGTYAGREHPERKQLEYEFLKKIAEVVNRGGIAVIPAFGVARIHEVMLILMHEKYDIWLDGMGWDVYKIYLKYSEYIKSLKDLRYAMHRVKLVRSKKHRELAMKGEVILTTSGMLDGGPVLNYLANLKNDTKSAILLTGYQIEGTNGRRLLETGSVNLYGHFEKINCEICFFDFSAHVGNKELLQFILNCKPKKIILCHSDNRETLAKSLTDYEVYIPSNGEEFEVQT